MDDKAAFYVAMDEIIKHNCYSNEFNYMQELYQKLKTDLLAKRTGSVAHEDWRRLFRYYDRKNNGSLSTVDLQKMMVDAGMDYATDKEV